MLIWLGRLFTLWVLIFFSLDIFPDELSVEMGHATVSLMFVLAFCMYRHCCGHEEHFTEKDHRSWKFWLFIGNCFAALIYFNTRYCQIEQMKHSARIPEE